MNPPPRLSLLSLTTDDQNFISPIEIQTFPVALEAKIPAIVEKALTDTGNHPLNEKLKKIARALQTHPASGQHTLEATYNEIPDNQKSLFITTLLKAFNGYQDQDKTAIIFSFLKHLHPELNQYFVFSKDGRTFTSKAIEILAGYLQANKIMDPALTCIVCDDCESFELQLDKLAEAPLNHKFGFIVRCQSKEGPKSAHVTSLFLQNLSSGWQALLLDAAGHESTILPFSSLTSKMKAKVFHGGDERQRNYTSCAVYALHDLATLSLEKDVFSSLAEIKHKEGDCHVKLDTEYLSLEVIKVTENAAKLQEAAKKKFSFSSTSEIEQTLFWNSIDKYLVNEKRTNDLIRRRHCKYERLMVTHFFNELFPTAHPR